MIFVFQAIRLIFKVCFHCALPSAHNIATAKVAIIFTGRLKRGNYGPYCSPNPFNGDFDNSAGLKRCLSSNSPHSSRPK